MTQEGAPWPNLFSLPLLGLKYRFCCILSSIPRKHSEHRSQFVNYLVDPYNLSISHSNNNIIRMIKKNYIVPEVAIRVRLETQTTPIGESRPIKALQQNKIQVQKIIAGFDNVYSKGESNQELFQYQVKPLIQKYLDGANVALMAYGQSGSGKTFTLTNTDPNNLGLVFMSFTLILESMKNSNACFHLTYLQIYNGKFLDLLSNSQKPLTVQKHTGMPDFERITKVPIKSFTQPYEVTNLILEGMKRRKTGSTKLNKTSSRSHSLMTLTMTSESKKIVSKLLFVDLAGSQNTKAAESQGETKCQAIYINSSLTTLRKVIKCLAEKSLYTPFRESVLTKVLEEVFRWGSLTKTLCCVRSSSQNLYETLNSLRYARDVSVIKIERIERETESLELKSSGEVEQLDLQLRRQEQIIFQQAVTIESLSSEIIHLKQHLQECRDEVVLCHLKWQSQPSQRTPWIREKQERLEELKRQRDFYLQNHDCLEEMKNDTEEKLLLLENLYPLGDDRYLRKVQRNLRENQRNINKPKANLEKLQQKRSKLLEKEKREKRGGAQRDKTKQDLDLLVEQSQQCSNYIDQLSSQIQKQQVSFDEIVIQNLEKRESHQASRYLPLILSSSQLGKFGKIDHQKIRDVFEIDQERQNLKNSFVQSILKFRRNEHQTKEDEEEEINNILQQKSKLQAALNNCMDRPQGRNDDLI